MPNSALFALLFAAGAPVPATVVAQGPMEVAMAGPQPHFVAAWAPEKEREAEHSAALARRVSLELQNVSLDAALKALTNRAGLRITYSQAILPKGKRVTLKAGDIAVVTALTEMLFRSGLDVVVDQDGTLALVRCKHLGSRAEVQDSGTIVGTVTDKATGSSLAGAAVVVEGTKRSATTGNDGRYRITGVEPGTYTVRARYIGYSLLSTPVTVGAGEEVTADFGLEKSTQKLDELVTTGTIVPTETKALSTPVSVIDEADITLQRPNTVQEAIRRAVPTAVAWDNPAAPYVTALSTRGASTLSPGGGQMKIFVDGIEAALPGRTPVDLHSIDRIEVVRGPQAATLYGSDATGGVVQIFTKRGDERFSRPRVSGEVALGFVQTPYDGFGSVLRQSYTGSLYGGRTNLSYLLGGSYSHTADYLPNGEISGQSAPSFYGGVRATTGILSVDASGRYYTTNAPSVFNPQILGSGFAFFSKPNFQPNQLQNQSIGLRVGLAPSNWLSATVTAGVDRLTVDAAQSRARLTTPSDTLLLVFVDNRTKSSIGASVSAQSRLAPAVTSSLTIGFDHWSLPGNRFVSGAAFNTEGTIQPGPGGTVSASRTLTNNTGYFAQAQIGFREALFLTGGLRAEQNTNFGDSLGVPISPRVGLAYAQVLGRATLKARASWGRSIRPPQPGAKLAQVTGSAVTLANPVLAPERQHGWDAGLDLFLGNRVFLSASYYDQAADNLIEYVQVDPSTAPPTYQFQNIARVRNTGAEIEASLSISSLNIKGQYGYSRARIDRLPPNYTGDLRVNDQALLTPKHTAGVSLSASPWVSTTLAGGLTYVGSWSYYDIVAQFACFGGTGPCRSINRDYISAYPGFVKLNASVSQQVTQTVTGFVSVEDLTNNQSFEFFNFNPVMGRITTAGVRLNY